MLRSVVVGQFFRDSKNPAYTTAFAIYHRPFSNVLTVWPDRALSQNLCNTSTREPMHAAHAGPCLYPYAIKRPARGHKNQAPAPRAGPQKNKPVKAPRSPRLRRAARAAGAASAAQLVEQQIRLLIQHAAQRHGHHVGVIKAQPAPVLLQCSRALSAPL